MKLVIFDVDGTLCDSRNLITEAQRRVFLLHGLAPPPGDSGLSVIGLSLKQVLSELAGPDAPLDEMVSDYHAMLPQLRNDVRYAETPFAGADALLLELAATPRVVLGIATGHQLNGLKPLIDRFGWQSIFSTIQTSCKAPSKPHPAMIFQAINEIGVTTDDAILIGDTTFDIEMAATAGIRSIGVSWGFHSEHRLRATGKCQIARDMTELRELILGWLQWVR